MQEQTQEPYSYWKKPWHPWLILTLDWGIAMVSLELFSRNVTGLLASLGLLLILGNAIWCLWSWQKYRTSRPR